MPDNSTRPIDEHTLRVQQLFVRHQQALLAYVLSIEPNLADAQDIVQETFLTVSRKARTFTEGTNFLAWACMVARYNTLHFQRTRARRVARLDGDVVELLHAGEVVDEGYFEQQVSAMQRCLDRLAPRARELVWLRYHGAKMPEQIAREVGWSVNAVRVALSRARTVLRKCVEHQLATQESP